MKYVGQTFEYLKKNILTVLIAFVMPSAVACFLSTPYWEVAFVTDFVDTPYISVSETFRLMFGDSWQYLWPVVVVAVVQVFGAALLMSVMDRHFRTGRSAVRPVWALINNSIFPIAIGVALMCALSIAWRFVLFGIVMLIQTSAEAMSFAPGAATAVIAAVAVVAFFIHVLMITPMLFWAPMMFIYGYKFRDAAAASYKMLSGQKVFLGLMLPMAICAGIQMLVGFLEVHIAIAITVNFFVFLFTNSYSAAYVMLSFYGISELERRDVRRYAPIVLPRVPEQKPENKEKQEKSEKPEEPVTPSAVKSEETGESETAFKCAPADKSKAKTKQSNKSPSSKNNHRVEKTPTEKEGGGVV